MKKLLLAVIIAMATMTFTAQESQARLNIVYSNGPTTQSIHAFEEPFKVENQSFKNFGIVFDQLSIMGVPIWNYGETTYALYNEYNLSIDGMEITAEDLPYLREELGIEIEDMPSLSFWNRIGGKLVLLLVIGAVIAYYVLRSGRGDGEKEQSDEPVERA